MECGYVTWKPAIGWELNCPCLCSRLNYRIPGHFIYISLHKKATIYIVIYLVLQSTPTYVNAVAGNSNSNSNSSSDSKNLNLQPGIFDISQIFRLIHVKLFRLERHARVVMSRNGLVTVIIEDNWSTTFSRELFKSRAIKMYRNKATSLVLVNAIPLLRIIYVLRKSFTIGFPHKHCFWLPVEMALTYWENFCCIEIDQLTHVLQIPRILCHTNPKNCHLELVIINRIGHALTTLGHSS